jgi:hypothetical protein
MRLERGGFLRERDTSEVQVRLVVAMLRWPGYMFEHGRFWHPGQAAHA